ncbi:thioredoxin [Haloarchaeobius litoreus]|uniref:Thioredoxin n=1 Tax=Haloarchaeobius litoreus TaxID=755306 RepID=A0ABD6DT93_9EURY|nr:thioredoxin [Haloarchaeobius litoreus]
MSGDSTIEDIREQKKQQLQNETDDDSASASADGVGPAEPVYVNGTDELTSTIDEYDVVLVDFYADWCGPCQMLEPVVESIAETTDAAVAKVDVDANQQLAAQFGVQGVPTMVLFADGDPVKQMVGFEDEGTLRSLIEQHS